MYKIFDRSTFDWTNCKGNHEGFLSCSLIYWEKFRFLTAMITKLGTSTNLESQKIIASFRSLTLLLLGSFAPIIHENKKASGLHYYEDELWPVDWKLKFSRSNNFLFLCNA